jgi:HAD superfamily hydrolase (TIGR01509 family)
MTNYEVKAIIFDMDGVLIEAKDWHYEALNKALHLFGLEISRHDHLITFDGLPTKKKLMMLTQERGLPESLHCFINDLKQKYTMEIINSFCHPVFHHEYTLSSLKREGYMLAVASNSVRNTVDAMLTRAHLIEYLSFYLSNEDVLYAKPDPEIYLTAINKLGLKPQECLIVEDNPNGIKAAQASGANVMHVVRTEDVTYRNIKNFINELRVNLC